MAIKKKKKKTKEELAIEGNFRVDKRDLKYATEKKVKKALPKQNILKNITEKPVTSPSGETLLTVDGEIVCVPSDFTE